MMIVLHFAPRGQRGLAMLDVSSVRFWTMASEAVALFARAMTMSGIPFSLSTRCIAFWQ